MLELQKDPAIQKLIEYAKEKKSISYDEVSDFLPNEIVNTERMEEVIAILDKHPIKLEEGGNIIKGAIRTAGVLVAEVYRIAVKASSKRDPREMNLTKKEATELLAERRRLNAL